MRVLLVVHSMELGGGVEAFLLSLIRALDRSAADLEVCCASGRPGSLAPELERIGIAVWCCRQRINPLAYMSVMSRELERRGPYDVVHTQTGHYGGPILAAAKRTGAGIRLAHYHNLCPGHKNDWPRRLYDRMMRRLVVGSATGIVGCSWAALRHHHPRGWTGTRE